MEVKVLLEKYYKGETSDQEEKYLKRYFVEHDVPDELNEEKEIFLYYSEESDIPDASGDFEMRIIRAVQNQETGQPDRKSGFRLFTLISAAAGVLLLIGSYFIFMNRSFEKDTFSDPQLAYAETLKILYNVSSKLNKGTSSLDQIRKIQEATSLGFNAVSKSAETFDRSMQNLDYFQKMLDIAESPLEIGRTK